MKNIYKLSIVLIISLVSLFQNSAKASHLTGVDFTYTCIGHGAQDTMLLTMQLFRDCAGIPAPTTLPVPITNSCGVSVSATFTQVTSLTATEVSMLCSTASSTCAGGSLPGMRIYVYQATYILPPTCAGSLQVTASGGTPGYIYSWPMAMSGSDIDLLCAGTYITTIQDNNGCTSLDSFELVDVSGMKITATSTPVSCAGVCDGTISVATTGGTAPYVYNWQDGSALSARTNLCSGIYSVTVMDADGSQYAYWINLEDPGPVISLHTVTDETCFGSCDGVIRTDISGGNAPYSIAWSNGLSGQVNSGLCSGSYGITVTDANGCVGSSAAVVTSNTNIVSSHVINTPLSCNNVCNGIATVSATGGVAPYVFSWSNGYVGANQIGLCAGTYVVTTTDATGCTNTQTIVLTQPSPILANASVVNSTCINSTGTITLAPSGGVGPYTYTWGITPSPGNTNTVSGLGAGVYDVTITDNNGCTSVTSYAVSTSAANSNAVITSPTCYLDSNGAVTLSPTGAVGPFTYLWSNGSTADSISAVSAGTFIVTVTDNTGCELVEILEVTEPSIVGTDITSSDPLCFGDCNGSISLTPYGGVGNYTEVWSNGGSGFTQTNLCSGSYSVTLTDGNNCSIAYNNIQLTDPLALQNTMTIVDPIDCKSGCNGVMEAVSTGGVLPHTYAWGTGASISKNYDLCVGTYDVTVTDANGCSLIDSSFINQPSVIQSTVTQVTAPGCTGTWSGGWGSCCRPGGGVNTTSGSFYGDFTMNTSMEPGGCNGGVQFEANPSTYPLKYVCQNDTVCYTFGVTEPDGDSLFFEFIPAKQTATTNVVYTTAGGIAYSGTNPINGITMNSATGEYCFVASVLGRFITAIQVSEYDPVTGLFKGRNMREIVFVVAPCAGNNEPPFLSNITNFTTSTGGAQAIDSLEIEMCEGDSFCFDIILYDSNLANTGLTSVSNIAAWLNGPGANDTATYSMSAVDTTVVNGDSLLRRTISICWGAPPNSGGSYTFYVFGDDDFCSIPGITNKNITVNVTSSVVAWPNESICGNQNSQLYAAGGTAFYWQSISGDPIQVGVNFSCDSCAAPVASPTQTSTYVVTSNINATCQNTDTITVTVVPDYQVIATADTILCNIDTVQLSAQASIPGVYSYQWNNSSSLSSDTISNPVAVPPGSTIYSVTMTSIDGCEKNSTVGVTVTPPFPGINPIAVDTVLCNIGDTTQLDVDLLTNNWIACGGSYTPCLNTTNYSILGTGVLVNGTTSYPAPFGNFRKSAKHQFLYRASELTALGLTAGLITEIGFDVAAVNGTSSYTDFTINMGCTSVNSMPASYLPAPTNVFPANTVNVTTGWNMMILTTPYIWDGVSNLIVEVCFEKSSSTSNTSTRMSNTTFTSGVYYANNFNNACTSALVSSALFQRPNIRFGMCAGADPLAYTYSWMPNSNISNTNIIDPFVWPDSTQTYSVIVNDTFGVCSDTGDILIYVGELDAGPDTLICEGDSIQLNATTTVVCPSGTETYSWLPAAAVSNPNIANPMISVTQTTTFVVTYTNSCGCSSVDSLTVFVNNMAAPIVTLTHPTCGINDGQILVQNSGGTAPFTYSIDTGNTFLVDSNFINLAMGGYTMQYIDSSGCISPLFSDTLINPGTPIIDSIVTVDPSCFSYNDGQILIYASGGTNPLRYSIDSVNFSINSQFTSLGAGAYTIVVRDDSLCQTFPQSISLVSNNQLFLDSVQFSNLLCNQDSSGVIQVYGHGGTAPLSYTINNGVSYSGLPTFTGLSAGTYSLIVKDALGCTTNMQNQAITEPAALLAAVQPVNDTCFNACGGSATSTVTGGTLPYTYSWRKGINNIGANFADISGLCEGNNYEFTIVDSNNCQETVPFVITHPDLLVATFTSTNISCNGADDGTIIVSGTGGTLPYKYSINGGNSFQNSNNFTGLPAGTYNIMISDSNGRCEAVTTSVITEPSLITLSTNITQKQLCLTGCTQLIANAQGGVGIPYNYIWNNGLDSNGTQSACPTQTTVYSVYAADSNGCVSDPIAITLTLFDSLRVDAGPDFDLCPTDQAQLNANASGGNGQGYNYLWTPITNLSGAYVQNPIAKPGSSTLYTVKVTDNCETPPAYDSVWVRINPVPNMGFHVQDTAMGCEPFDFTLVNTSNPVQFAEWTIGNDITALGFSADITDLMEGVYDVTLKVTTVYGCVDELTYENYITVYPLPTPKFDMNPEFTTVFNTIVQFEDQSIGDIQAWSWDFTGFSSSTEQNPVFQYPADTGNFPITLTVTTTKECKDDVTHLLRIGSEYNMYVPNSFTPNGDGQNDVFSPRGVGVDPDKYSFRIYDRWGGLVFESISLSEPWDGRAQGTTTMAENGVYVWKIVAHDKTDEAEGHQYQGTVTLIR